MSFPTGGPSVCEKEHFCSLPAGAEEEVLRGHPGHQEAQGVQQVQEGLQVSAAETVHVTGPMHSKEEEG